MRYTVHASNTTLHVAEGRFVTQPRAGSYIVDLRDHIVRPGLINAHDHLELNHYPRTKFRERYDNAHQWGEDVSAQLDTPPYRELRAYPLWDRCFIGGLKNLICGATTVVQHGPLHRSLRQRGFPVRVVKRYGWAHSLHFDSPEQVRTSHAASRGLWFIHLAEGTDTIAAAEYAQLRGLGCADANTILVHGVGLRPEDLSQAASTVNALVWCPVTNEYLLGQTADIAAWRKHRGRLLLGSDSRLTAVDLLNEMARAAEVIEYVWELVTVNAADILHLPLPFAPRTPADWLAYPTSLDSLPKRNELSVVVKNGVPQIGDPQVTEKFRQWRSVRATLDGTSKQILTRLARQIVRCKLAEPGLSIES